MSRSKRGRISMLAGAAFLLGSLLLLGCQPSQPVPLGTPKTAEKGAAATPTKAAEKAAATPAKAVEKPVRGGTLRAITTQDLASLDPHADVENDATWQIFDHYIWLDKDANPTKEGLIRDWTISADGKAITFKLREGVKFQDGTDWDAAAVKFNIERVKDPATKSSFRSFWDFVVSVEVVDNLTARFNLSQPDPVLLVRMGARGGMVVSPAAVKKYGQDFGRNPVGSGPFQLEKWQQGDYISLKRFEGYWRKDQDGNRLPYLDGIVWRVISDPTTSVVSLRTGQNDATRDVELGQWPLVKNDPNLNPHTVRQPLYQIVAFNNKRPPFNNKALREAVALAVDREGMAAAQGEGTDPHASVIHPAYTWAYDPKVGVFPARDLAKAKAKMAEAGYAAGGLKVKLPSQTSSQAVKTNQILQANLAEIGIEAEVATMAIAEYFTYLLTQEAESKYQVMLQSTPNVPVDVGSVFSIFFHSKGSRNNLGPYSNPQVDKLIEQGGSTYDQKQRAPLYQQAATMIREDMPVVPLYLAGSRSATNKKVRNFVPFFDNYLRFWQTWLAP